LSQQPYFATNSIDSSALCHLTEIPLDYCHSTFYTFISPTLIQKQTKPQNLCSSYIPVLNTAKSWLHIFTEDNYTIFAHVKASIEYVYASLFILLFEVAHPGESLAFTLTDLTHFSEFTERFSHFCYFSVHRHIDDSPIELQACPVKHYLS